MGYVKFPQLLPRLISFPDDITASARVEVVKLKRRAHLTADVPNNDNIVLEVPQAVLVNAPSYGE